MLMAYRNKRFKGVKLFKGVSIYKREDIYEEKTEVYELSEETVLKRKIIIIVGVIVAVVAIVVGIIIFTQDNNTELENTSENISQNDDNQVVVDDIMGMEDMYPTVMKETIDLHSVDLTEYGLTNDNEISIPYPTSLGCAYVVRDYGEDEEQTYLFVTTKDSVMYLNTEFPSSGRLPIEDVHSLKIADLDGEKGEEIVLLANTGGCGGAGIYCNGIYKISNSKIVEMKISDEEPFEVSLEASYTVVFKNEKFDYEERLVCERDSELLFDDAGNPDMSSMYFEEYDSYDGGFYASHEAGIYTNDNGQSSVCFTSWSYLSRSVDEEEVESVVEYSYDSESNQFVITYVRVDICISEDVEETYGSMEEYWDMMADTNGYTYYDINKDGVDEFITHTGSCEADRVYRVYTFVDGKMICAGAFGGWHGTLYEQDKLIIIVSSGATENGTLVTSVTYEIVDDKLVEKGTFEKEFIDDAEWEDYFESLNNSGKVIKVNNLYYR